MIYDGALHDTTNISSFEYIAINSCNIQHTAGSAYTVVRAKGRVDYHILYIAEGECTCLYNGAKHVLTKSHFVVYPPNVKQWYSFAQGVPATTLWIHFSGSGVESTLRALDICGGIYRAPLEGEVEVCFQKMMCNHSVHTGKCQVAARGNLIELLSALAPECTGAQSVTYPRAVIEMVEYIHSNWQSALSVADVAKRIGLSESRAAHLFKNAIGKGVHCYITDMRISAAKEQLLNTQLSISEISSLMGFHDALYFSRAFKSRVGCSPYQYRKSAERETE